MLRWIPRTAVFLWSVLDAMAESPGPWPALEQQGTRIARLEARIAELETQAQRGRDGPARAP